MASDPVLIAEALDDGYSESVEWVTDVFTSENGTESRAALLSGTVPVRTVTMPLGPALRQELARLEGVLRYGSRGTIFVPRWFSVVALTAPTDATTTLHCIPDGHGDFIAGEYLLILSRDRLTAFLTTTATRGANTITAGDAVPVGFAIGDSVVPCIVATPPKTGALQTKLSGSARGTVAFQEVR